MLLTQTLSMLLAAVLDVLTITGVIQIWMVVLLAFCSGMILSFDQPARFSLVPILVPKEDLVNAISLLVNKVKCEQSARIMSSDGTPSGQCGS